MPALQAAATLRHNVTFKLSTNRFLIGGRNNAVRVAASKQVWPHDTVLVSAHQRQQHLPGIKEEQRAKTLVASNQCVDTGTV
jgi:hypothetical protein